MSLANYKKGFIEGPAVSFTRTKRREIKAVSATDQGAGGVCLEIHEEDFYHVQTRVALRPATAVHAARSLLNQLSMGHLQDVDVHDLKNIETTVRMLIKMKEADK